MANIEEHEEPVASTPEGDEEEEIVQKKKPSSKAKEDDGKSGSEGEGKGDEDEEDEDEQEYEIEAILDAKKGYFTPVCFMSMPFFLVASLIRVSRSWIPFGPL